MSTLSPDKWSALSPYLDKALTLSEAERAHWLEALRAENPDLARQLQELLSEHQAAQQEAFLETSPITLRIIQVWPARLSVPTAWSLRLAMAAWAPSGWQSAAMVVSNAKLR